MRSLFNLGLVFLLCGASAGAAEPTKDSLQTVRQNLDGGKAVLIDVREPDEWDDGHLAAASLLPLSRIEKGVSADQLGKIAPAGKIIYLHCAYGSRCLSAADELKRLGRDIRPLKHGYDDLVKAGFKPAGK